MQKEEHIPVLFGNPPTGVIQSGDEVPPVEDTQVQVSADHPFREFDNAAHAELAQLLVDSGDASACIEHFTNEGYHPGEILNRLNILQQNAVQTKMTAPLTSAEAAPRNPLCPEPFFGGGFYQTPAGAKVLFELRDPHVVLLDNFLSEQECDHLIAISEPNFARSLVAAAEGNTISEARSSQTAHTTIGFDEVVRAIEARIAAMVHWPVLNAESLQIIRYGIGEKYDPHYDFFHKTAMEPHLSSPYNQRTATLIMYLQEPQMGGATFFPNLKLRVPARRGQALFFSYPETENHTSTYHAGEPVFEGTKTIATKWFKTLQHGK